MHDDLRDRVLRTLAAIIVGCAAPLTLAPTAASAITAVPAIYDNGTNTKIIHEIGEKRRHSHDSRGHYSRDYRQHHHHHHYGYGPYRPYYGYGYWPDYYYYGGYGYDYPYWSRPGVSIGFSFSN